LNSKKRGNKKNTIFGVKLLSNQSALKLENCKAVNFHQIFLSKLQKGAGKSFSG